MRKETIKEETFHLDPEGSHIAIWDCYNDIAELKGCGMGSISDDCLRRLSRESKGVITIVVN